MVLLEGGAVLCWVIHGLLEQQSSGQLTLCLLALCPLSVFAQRASQSLLSARLSDAGSDAGADEDQEMVAKEVAFNVSRLSLSVAQPGSAFEARPLPLDRVARGSGQSSPWHAEETAPKKPTRAAKAEGSLPSFPSEWMSDVGPLACPYLAGQQGRQNGPASGSSKAQQAAGGGTLEAWPHRGALIASLAAEAERVLEDDQVRELRQAQSGSALPLSIVPACGMGALPPLASLPETDSALPP